MHLKDLDWSLELDCVSGDEDAKPTEVSREHQTYINCQLLGFSLILLWRFRAVRKEMCRAMGHQAKILTDRHSAPTFCGKKSRMGTLLCKALISCSGPIRLYSQENSGALPNFEESLRDGERGKPGNLHVYCI